MTNRGIRRIGLSYVIGFGPQTSGEMVQAAVIAEKHRFHAVLVPEHYYDRDAPSILGSISQRTSRIMIGTGVINPFTRYPSLIAMTAATLSELSGGRIFIGLGSGGVIGSLAHGIPSEFVDMKFSHPLGHMEEMVYVLRRLLSGERVTFSGRFYNLDGVKINFRPSPAKIPIYFGQQGPNMMKLAGRIADGVIITLCCTVPYVRKVVELAEKSRRSSREAPQSMDFAARIITSVSSDQRAAIKRAKPLVGRVFIHPGARPVAEASGFELDSELLKEAIDSGDETKLDRCLPDEVVEMTTACGTKGQIVERLAQYEKAGVTLPLIVPIGRDYKRAIEAVSPM
ncbi:MAG TPA: LLM class flavin-dependent oxidoreductase [Nitrososphaerales archaeon]|nr:LLM class flavin-dependent oxidoreductase [Nitrososphaerales archaeon]